MPLVATMADSDIHERFRECQRLAKEGKSAQALDGMLWCFDQGMKDVPAMAGVRRSYLLTALVRLGETYPPAGQALRERQGAVRQKLTTALGDAADWLDFVAINRSLGEDSVTLAFYDQARATGTRVPSSRPIHRQLSEAGRYLEALEARPLEDYLLQFDRYAQWMTDRAEMPREQHVGHLARISAQMLKTLAGAGDLTNAQAIVTKMLQTDRSAETLATLRASAIRAGHPELIPAE